MSVERRGPCDIVVRISRSVRATRSGVRISSRFGRGAHERDFRRQATPRVVRVGVRRDQGSRRRAVNALVDDVFSSAPNASATRRRRAGVCRPRRARTRRGRAEDDSREQDARATRTRRKVPVSFFFAAALSATAGGCVSSASSNAASSSAFSSSGISGGRSVRAPRPPGLVFML